MLDLRDAGRSVALAWSVLAIVSAGVKPSPAVTQEHVFFSRTFPGSSPPSFEVKVDRAGRGIYDEGDPEEAPIEFQLLPNEVAALFGLVEKLDHFHRPVASDRKVAFTGDKILRYVEPAGETTEVKFSFTEDADARALVTWFVRVSESERYLIELERVYRFDRLGVNKALLQFQTSFDKKRIVAPHQFLPILKKIAAHKGVLHIARARAASLVERIGESGDGP